jgi:hypothetical protein
MRWGLIGASNIAASHMIGAMRSTGGEVVSVLSSSPERASSYAREHGVAEGFSDLDTLLQGDIDAVYISTTNEKHFPQAMAAICGGQACSVRETACHDRSRCRDDGAAARTRALSLQPITTCATPAAIWPFAT